MHKIATRLSSSFRSVKVTFIQSSNHCLQCFQFSFKFPSKHKGLGGINCSIDSTFTAATLSHLLLSTPLLQPPRRLSTQRAHVKKHDLNYTWHALKQSISAILASNMSFIDRTPSRILLFQSNYGLQWKEQTATTVMKLLPRKIGNKNVSTNPVNFD